MDRRLGRPLPHQLPNPTRADPLAINLSPVGLIRYHSQFPGAVPYQGARSHALLTRPPLEPKSSLDLHVLGLPPAFVLSQDQTLKLKRPEGRPLDDGPCTSRQDPSRRAPAPCPKAQGGEAPPHHRTSRKALAEQTCKAPTSMTPEPTACPFKTSNLSNIARPKTRSKQGNPQAAQPQVPIRSTSPLPKSSTPDPSRAYLCNTPDTRKREITHHCHISCRWPPEGSRSPPPQQGTDQPRRGKRRNATRAEAIPR